MEKLGYVKEVPRKINNLKFSMLMSKQNYTF